MSFLGNILWFICGGFLTGVAYLLGGLALCLTIVGIPFGLQSIKLGFAAFAPFGKEVREGANANSPLKVVFNLIWLVVFGWEIALVHLAHALGLAVTIIGIPFALQHLKMVPLALFPFGRELR